MVAPRPGVATVMFVGWAAGVQYPFRVLRFEPDPSLADWFARRDEPWGELVTMGPTGFESYARVGYLEEDRISQRVLFARLRAHLAGRANTPVDCFHGLWDGAVSGMHGDPARGISPWFPADVLTGPKVRIPHREYMLFLGHLDEVGHWGATDPATDSSRDEELPAPHLLWPADQRAPFWIWRPRPAGHSEHFIPPRWPPGHAHLSVLGLPGACFTSRARTSCTSRPAASSR